MSTSFEKMDEFVNLKETELWLGLPGTDNVCEERENVSCCNKRAALPSDSESEIESSTRKNETSPPRKAQIVGWPPVRSYRKNNIQTKKNESDNEGQGIYVKVSMDGAPYLRKIDLSCYKGYSELLKTLEMMFKFCVGEYSERQGYESSDFVPTYEDKDGDWMLIGDVPWEMFVRTCKRLRIMKGSEAKGLGCVVSDKAASGNLIFLGQENTPSVLGLSGKIYFHRIESKS